MPKKSNCTKSYSFQNKTYNKYTIQLTHTVGLTDALILSIKNDASLFWHHYIRRVCVCLTH